MDLRAALAAARAGSEVGLVPTMGALHGGHEALLRRARDECDVVVASIFVNPAQFGADEDLDAYPRDEQGDIRAAEAWGVDQLFVPSVEEMYPDGFQTWVDVERAAEGLEGAARPGHFRGVATVCLKLFNIVLPQRAYFGQKDAQQVMVIERMASDLAMPTRVIPCPTVREPDGLAISSRNVHLTPEERSVAPVVYRALVGGKSACEQGERDAEALRDRMREVLAAEPLVRVEYVSCADAATLRELRRIEGPALLSLAVVLGTTRLIDNVRLDG